MLPNHTLARLDGDTGSGRPDMLRYALLDSLPFTASATSVTALGSITAGTGFTGLPTLAPTGGTGSGLVVAATSLKVVSATQSVAGTGYVTSDTITLANGVVLTVTASSGAITALSVTSAGSATAAPMGAQPIVSTSGVGVGATVNLVWGLGTAQIINSGNYSGAPSVAVTGGGGTGASIAAATLGGNGAAVFVGQAVPELPAKSMCIGMPSVACFQSQPSQVQGFAYLALTPILAGSTLAAGVCDILVMA